MSLDVLLRGLGDGPEALRSEMLLPRVVATAVEILEADAGTIALPASADGALRYACLTNLPSHLSTLPRNNLAGLALESGSPMLVTDYPDHPGAIPELVRLGVQTALSYPLKAGGERVGCLDLMRLSPRPFTHSDLERLSPLAFVATLVLSEANRSAQIGWNQEDLLEQERLATTGRLAPGLAHRLNNPLGAIVLQAEILAGYLSEPRLEGSELRPQLVEATEVITREVLRCKALVGRLLEFSRRASREPQRVELEAVISEAQELAELQVQWVNSRIVRHRAEKAVSVCGNPVMLRLLVLNLVMNALEAGGKHGTVTLAAALVGPGSVRITVASGEAPAVAPAPEGSRVSFPLALCRRIVREHGGQLEVENPNGGGWTAVVELPRFQEGDER
ncbi:MAG: GAF domain-containing protein [Candidatus Methylomirabilia bacterium]